jgi:L-lactate dehydrogenase complex protein LldG
MEKVCQDWTAAAFDDTLIEPSQWDAFVKNAAAASAEVSRVNGWEGVHQAIAGIISELKVKKIVAVGAEQNPALKQLYEELAADGADILTDRFDIAEAARTADLGISAAEFGVAETGSVCVDTFSYEARVVGMLPPAHIVLMNAAQITRNLTTAFQMIARVYQKGHMGLITGPSRTADIERVLTLGVHGPSRFFIIAIDGIEGSVD